MQYHILVMVLAFTPDIIIVSPRVGGLGMRLLWLCLYKWNEISYLWKYQQWSPVKCFHLK